MNKHQTLTVENLGNPSEQSLFDLNKPFLGGGMSQTYSSIYLLEFYIRIHDFEYVVEIGTNKGALSLYLANLACATERFSFETYDISHRALYDRTENGVGHWLDKVCDMSTYSKIFLQDVFSFNTVNYIESQMFNRKSLILCDGGNKAKEVETYSKLLKPGDRIMAHDWKSEIQPEHIDFSRLQYDEPYHSHAQTLKTQWGVFKLKE